MSFALVFPIWWFFQLFCLCTFMVNWLFREKKKRSVRLRDASQPLKTRAWHEFIDSNTVNSMVWETRTSLAAWFQEGQCQFYLVNLHFELALFSPCSFYPYRNSLFELPTFGSLPRSTSAGAAASPTSDKQMVTLSRLPNLLHRARAKMTVRKLRQTPSN